MTEQRPVRMDPRIEEQLWHDFHPLSIICDGSTSDGDSIP